MHMQIVQGDSFYAQLQWCNQLGQPFALTDFAPKVALVDYRGNDSLVFAHQILDAANGLFEVKKVDTSQLPIGNYYLAVVYSKGQIKTTMLPLTVEVVATRTQQPFRHYKIGGYNGFTKLLLRDSTEQASVTAFESDWSEQENSND